jgi:hypothetical protein
MQPLLSDEVLSLIQPYTGTVEAIRPLEHGYRSGVKAVIESERGRLFVKAYHEPGEKTEPQEVALNPHLRGMAPRVQGYVCGDEWTALVYDFIGGRHPDLRPGSPDVPLIVGTVDRIGSVVVPDSVQLRDRARKGLVSDEETALLGGSALIHFDINPDNILISDRQVWIVDWEGSRRGAAFINLAELVMQLICAGHSAEEAERCVSGCQSWATADPAALGAWATFTVRTNKGWYPELDDRYPAGSWLSSIKGAVKEWAAYRGVSA